MYHENDDIEARDQETKSNNKLSLIILMWKGAMVNPKLKNSAFMQVRLSVEAWVMIYYFLDEKMPN